MGVMQCSRNGCDNIMCNRRNEKHGYICNDCFEELVLLGAETNVSNFMRSPKLDRDLKSSYARFNLEFQEAYKLGLR